MDVDSLIGGEVASHLLPEIFPFNLQINSNPYKSLRRRETINRLKKKAIKKTNICKKKWGGVDLASRPLSRSRGSEGLETSSNLYEVGK